MEDKYTKNYLKRENLSWVSRVMETICLIYDDSNKYPYVLNSSNFREINLKMTRENYLLSANINDSYPHIHNWLNYKNRLINNVLPMFIQSLMSVSDAVDDSVTFQRLLKAVSRATVTHSSGSTVSGRLIEIVCDNFVRDDHSQQQPDQSLLEQKKMDEDDQGEKDDFKEEEKVQQNKSLNFKFDLKHSNDAVINVLNSPIVWKRLLNEKRFDIFVVLMKKYIKQIHLTKLSEKNLIHPSNFHNHSKYYPSYKIPNNLDGQDCNHPIYGFFAATCIWGVKRIHYRKYKEYISQMFWSIMYPNMTIFAEFYANNDSLMTNMNETFSLFEYIYKNIDIVTQGRFYASSDIWIQPSQSSSQSRSKCHSFCTCNSNINNLDKVSEFVRFTMNKSLSRSKTNKKQKPKCIFIKKLYQWKDNLNVKTHEFKQWIHDFVWEKFIENCKQFILMVGVFLIYFVISLICCPCTCKYLIEERSCPCACAQDETTRNIEIAMRNQKQVEDQYKRILLLGIGMAGKSTLFKQIKEIYPPIDDKFEKHQSEKESALEETKIVIRMNIVAEMAVLISRAIMYHEEDPESYTKPTYPEAYEKFDESAPDGRYIVNIKEATETIVAMSKDVFSDPVVDESQQMSSISETDEYLFVLGIYIECVWEQAWIKEMYAKRKCLFTLSDNIDYFFNKASVCMVSDYKISDEDYVKSRVRTTGVISHQFPYQTTFARDGYNIHQSHTILITDTGGERNERKKWIHNFDRVATLVFVSSLNHCFQVLYEEETKTSMWEALDLFHDTLDGKWFRHTPVVVLLNHEDLFRESIKSGSKLSDCFDADEKTHPNAEWSNAYDENKSKYNGIEWDIDRDFQATSEYTKEEIANMYFEDVIHTQIDFISELFLDIGVQHGKIRSENIFVHITTATDKDCVKKQFDTILHDACIKTMLPVMYDAL